MALTQRRRTMEFETQNRCIGLLPKWATGDIWTCSATQFSNYCCCGAWWTRLGAGRPG